MTDPKIILTRGIQGSGKSTWARFYCEATPGAVRVNRDDIRKQMYDSYWGDTIDEDLVTKVESSMAQSALRAGATVVVDATHLYQKHVNRWQKLGYPVQIVEFSEPLDTLIERNENRERSVPASVIRQNFAKFATDEAGTLKPVRLRPEWFVTSGFGQYVPDPWLDQAYIFDIDGTLAHMTGRSPYDYSRVGEDRVDVRVRDMLLTLEQTHKIVIVSGRKDDCRAQTEAWLTNNFITYDDLFMRRADDGRPDTIVKYEILMRDIAPKYNVLGAFDDRNSVVQMWRNAGVKCYHVEEGDF